MPVHLDSLYRRNRERFDFAIKAATLAPANLAPINTKAKNPCIPPAVRKHFSLCSTPLTGFVCLSILLALTGCHSAYVNATVSNRTPTAISLVQVEYPSASFGTQAIAPGADFHYRFKILGSGPMKITYTDTAQHEQKATGPVLHEGTEGNLTIAVSPDGVRWQSPAAR